MDLMKKAAAGSGAEGWTDERHASYLNMIEEHFVRTMLAGGGGGGGGAGGGAIMTKPPSLRLDRYVPDSTTESNRDRATTTTDSGNQNLASRNHNTNKKRMLPLRDESQDQVVPEKAKSPKNKKGGKQASRWL